VNREREAVLTNLSVCLPAFRPNRL